MRVRIIKNNTDEPELVGMTGDVARVKDDGTVVVFLDGDSMPTEFPPGEVTILG